MSEAVIVVHERTDERFFAEIDAVRRRYKVLAVDIRRDIRPEYRWFRLVGLSWNGGTARFVVDLNDVTVEAEAPLFV